MLIYVNNIENYFSKILIYVNVMLIYVNTIEIVLILWILMSLSQTDGQTNISKVQFWTSQNS